MHTDSREFWATHHRVHVVIQTNPATRMCVDEHFIHMPQSSSWVMNNSSSHGVINDGDDRIHLMMDFANNRLFNELLQQGESVEGELMPELLSLISQNEGTGE